MGRGKGRHIVQSLKVRPSFNIPISDSTGRTDKWAIFGLLSVWISTAKPCCRLCIHIPYHTIHTPTLTLTPILSLTLSQTLTPNVTLERVPYRNSLAFVKFCLNLTGQLCRDLNPGARDVVDKHLSTRPRSLSTGYSRCNVICFDIAV